MSWAARRHYRENMDFIIAQRDWEAIDMYLAGWSLRQIGVKIGVSHVAVSKILNRHNVARRDSTAARVTRRSEA